MRGTYIAVIASACCFILLSDASLGQSQASRSQQLQQSDAPPGLVPPPQAVPGRPMRDLVVSKVFFTPAFATMNDQITINVEITNRGFAAAVLPSGKYIWLATKPGRDRDNVGPFATRERTLGPGMAITYSSFFFSAGDKAPGVYQVAVTVDPQNGVNESIETNNQFLCTLSIFESDWRSFFQQASILVHEILPRHKNEAVITKIAAELESGARAMSTAEQFLNRKPIDGRTARASAEALRAHSKRLGSMMYFQVSDQKTNQLFNILATVMKSMQEMESGTVRNILE